MDCIMSCVVLFLVVLINYSEADIKLSGSAMLVSRVTSLVCQSNVNLSRYPGRMVAYHQWNQVYNAKTDHFITNLTAIEALNTQLTIEFEKFDNNTDIYSSFGVYNASNGNQLVFNLTIYCSGMKGTWINLLDDGFYEYKIDKIFHYDITKQTTFSCQAYSDLSDNIQVGWINTVTNKIFVYNEMKTQLTLTAAHNGSMLCCIYYTVNVDTNGWKKIRRFVKDKTLLIKEHVPSIVEPRGTTTENYCENSNVRLISDVTCVRSPNANGRNFNTTNEKRKNSNATNKLGKYSNSTNEPGKNSISTEQPGKNSISTNEPSKNSIEPSKNSDTTNEPGKNFNSINEPGKNSNATNEPGKNSYATNELGKNSYATNEPGKNSNASNEPGKNSNTTNETDSKINATDITDSSDHDSDTSNYLTIIISSSASVLVLLVVIYVVINKRCRRDTNRRERPQLPLPQIPSQRTPDELDPHSPFYVNLLFRRECQLEIQAREEPQYEEIMYQ